MTIAVVTNCIFFAQKAHVEIYANYSVYFKLIDSLNRRFTKFVSFLNSTQHRCCCFPGQKKLQIFLKGIVLFCLMAYWLMDVLPKMLIWVRIYKQCLFFFRTNSTPAHLASVWFIGSNGFVRYFWIFYAVSVNTEEIWTMDYWKTKLAKVLFTCFRLVNSIQVAENICGV